MELTRVTRRSHTWGWASMGTYGTVCCQQCCGADPLLLPHPTLPRKRWRFNLEWLRLRNEFPGAPWQHKFKKFSSTNLALPVPYFIYTLEFYMHLNMNMRRKIRSFTGKYFSVVANISPDLSLFDQWLWNRIRSYFIYCVTVNLSLVTILTLHSCFIIKYLLEKTTYRYFIYLVTSLA